MASSSVLVLLELKEPFVRGILMIATLELVSMVEFVLMKLEGSLAIAELDILAIDARET